MCWNFDEEKISRVAAFITDSILDKRCDETPASVELPYSSRERSRPMTEEQILTLTDR